MAVATAVLRPKQSERLAATLYSPPETWTSKVRALRNGMTPGSSRWTRAPSESRSSRQPTVPGGTRAVLTVSLGERTWVLEQDARYPSRWRLHSDPDHRRHWS